MCWPEGIYLDFFPRSYAACIDMAKGRRGESCAMLGTNVKNMFTSRIYVWKCEIWKSFLALLSSVSLLCRSRNLCSHERGKNGKLVNKFYLGGVLARSGEKREFASILETWRNRSDINELQFTSELAWWGRLELNARSHMKNFSYFSFRRKLCWVAQHSTPHLPLATTSDAHKTRVEDYCTVFLEAQLTSTVTREEMR